jgi:hypothetical protein
MLHTGWTKKFGSAWDSIFGGKKKSAGKSKSGQATVVPKKKSAKKTAKGKR